MPRANAKKKPAGQAPAPDATTTPGGEQEQGEGQGEQRGRDPGWTWPEEGTLQALEAAMAERRAARDALEAYEAARTKTPLALVLEVVSCHWAVPAWPDKANVPLYSWPTRKCHLGKETPDQDCRLCHYCRIIRFGTQEPHHRRRYHEAGMVLPVPVDKADDVAATLRTAGLAPLRSVDAEIDALGQATEAMRARREEDRRRDLEDRQRGPRPRP